MVAPARKPNSSADEIALLRKEKEEMRCVMNDAIATAHQLISTQGLLQSLLHNAPDGIFILNSKHEIESFNTAAEKIFGYKEVDLIDRSIDELNLFDLPQDYHVNVVQYLLDSSSSGIENHVMGLSRNGASIPLRVSTSKIISANELFFADEDETKNPTSDFEALLCYVFDISKELQQLNNMRIQAQFLKEASLQFQEEQEKAERANMLKSEFLANMSHELRTPMQAILGFADRGISKAETGNTKALLRYFTNIKTGGVRLLTLLNDLLDLSKLESGKTSLALKQHDLRSIITTCLAELKSLSDNKSISIEVAATEFPTIVWCDVEKITQVVLNLLSNAIKFSPEEDKIVLTLEQTELDLENQDEEENRSHSAIAVSVIDNGVGIPTNELTAIFDKFVQSSRTRTGSGGTGLGLSICQEIISMHQGTIGVTSAAGSGSNFTFVIPVEKPLGSSEDAG